ncbi:hypothetical protein [Streptomyces noursei]|uniref:hypothetical protein n=1 Tax=Streptomyces noursei TaxID=1971 RepID=UPI001963EA02|nr:hypothetical protein [Streptomyces noursei]QRX94792.1 hypothetical protein JNO44_31625 [Streptomyces noursei]
MRKLALIPLTLAALGLTALAAPSASAHNAGQVTTPDGQCVTVGSVKEAPVVGQGAPQTTSGNQLDLYSNPVNGSDTSDQFGTSYVAAQGGTPIQPMPCVMPYTRQK